MLLFNSNVELVEQQPTLDGIYKQIELVGRSCWMSQNLITEDSATSFIETLKKRNHTAPFEHGTVYLTMPFGVSGVRYAQNPYTKYISDGTNEYITTNYRVLYENNWLEDLKYIDTPTKHEQRLTFHYSCQRAISAEFNRHRHNSMMESSSRYCNFAGNKFGGEISLIVSDWAVDYANERAKQKYFRKPQDLDAIAEHSMGFKNYCATIANECDQDNMDILDYWLFANLACEYAYMHMINLGAKAEEAREILPMDLKTELYHTAFVSDWIHFCNLRAFKTEHNKPHPEAMRLAKPIYNLLVERNLWNEEIIEETKENDN